NGQRFSKNRAVNGPILRRQRSRVAQVRQQDPFGREGSLTAQPFDKRLDFYSILLREEPIGEARLLLGVVEIHLVLLFVRRLGSRFGRLVRRDRRRWFRRIDGGRRALFR